MKVTAVMEENSSVKSLDEAFNDLRRKIDYIKESCRWQSELISTLLQKLQNDSCNGGKESENRDY